MNCAHCGTVMSGHKRKYCTKTCCNKASWARRTPSAVTCSVEGCENERRARGMCTTHYNRTLPQRHRVVKVPCAACGVVCDKEPSQLKRYGAAYCSLACRDYDRHGARACELPASHWARWWGTASEWAPPTQSARAWQCGSCHDCGQAIIEPASQTPSTYCSITCTKRSAKRRRRAREHGAPGDFTFAQLMRQYARQGSVCAYCRQPASPPDPEHVLPLSRGGRNDMSNIVAACRPCNADKNDLTLTEWAADRARRGLPMVDTSLVGAAYSSIWIREPERPAWRDVA